MTGLGYGDFYPQTGLGRLVSTMAFGWGALMAALLVMTTIREMELSNVEIRVNNLIAVSESNARLQRSQSSGAALLGNEVLHSDGRFCRTMRRFRDIRKELMKPNDVLHMLFQARVLLMMC